VLFLFFQTAETLRQAIIDSQAHEIQRLEFMYDQLLIICIISALLNLTVISVLFLLDFTKRIKKGVSWLKKRINNAFKNTKKNHNGGDDFF